MDYKKYYIFSDKHRRQQISNADPTTQNNTLTNQKVAVCKILCKFAPFLQVCASYISH